MDQVKKENGAEQVRKAFLQKFEDEKKRMDLRNQLSNKLQLKSKELENFQNCIEEKKIKLNS